MIQIGYPSSYSGTTIIRIEVLWNVFGFDIVDQHHPPLSGRVVNMHTHIAAFDGRAFNQHIGGCPPNLFDCVDVIRI